MIDLPNIAMMNGVTSVPVCGSSGSIEQEEMDVLVANSYNRQLIRVHFVTATMRWFSMFLSCVLARMPNFQLGSTALRLAVVMSPVRFASVQR